MFLITQDKQQCKAALEKLRENLDDFPSGPIHLFPQGKYFLGWFGIKPSDNLHIYHDGMIIGKGDFAEANTWNPIIHYSPMPSNIHPLLQSVMIRSKQGSLIIEPNGSTNVYVEASCVSDMQLLIADAIDARPGTLGIAMLASVGYFVGNITLFDEIEKIPLLHIYDMDNCQLTSISTFDVQKNDDDAMIERLIQIVPEGVLQYIGLSGGYDSRFVLGCLINSGVKPIAVHFTNKEDKIVTEIADTLNLQMKLISRDELLPDYLYTIMTDAQIYFRGGNTSQARKAISSKSLYYTGLYEPCIKSPFKTAWKIPGPRKTFLSRLVKYGLLQNVPQTIKSLRFYSDKQDLIKNILNKIKFEEQYYDFNTQQEIAKWFYYMNRGLRWTPAVMADLSFYCYPMYLLSDLTALSFGISSSAWSNLRKERVRALNHSLLPTVEAPYIDGYPAVEPHPLLAGVDKIKYEYFDRFLTHKEGLKEFHKKTDSIRSLFNGQIQDDRSEGFLTYFTEPYYDLIDEKFSYGEKRAATTLCHVLKYLNIEEDRSNYRAFGNLI